MSYEDPDIDETVDDTPTEEDLTELDDVVEEEVIEEVD